MRRCPTCKKPLDPNASQHAPFCSERCKLIDLGRWFDGEFRVPGEPAEIPEAPPFEGDDDEDS